MMSKATSCLLLLATVVTVAVAEFEIQLDSVPNPWRIEISESNTVAFKVELLGVPGEEFQVTTTKCDNDSSGDYDVSSTNDVSNMVVNFTNAINIVETAFCVVIDLQWNGEIVQDVAAFTFERTVKSDASGTQEEQVVTPETSLQVTTNVQEDVLNIQVTREPPEMLITLLNTGVITYGEDVSMSITSPAATGYEFDLISAQTLKTSGTMHPLTVVNGGPGPSGVVVSVNGFDIWDFASSAPITMELEIRWSISGASVRRHRLRTRILRAPSIETKSSVTHPKNSGTSTVPLQIVLGYQDMASSASDEGHLWRTLCVGAFLFLLHLVI